MLLIQTSKKVSIINY